MVNGGKQMRIAVFTGAGVSAESGIPTFRDKGGVWQQFKPEEIASIEGWRKNPKKVLEFYNIARRELQPIEPNAAHFAIADLQNHHHVEVITQNVDRLHELAGSNSVLHLLGDISRYRADDCIHRCFRCPSPDESINIGDTCKHGWQYRPDIVWFGERVPDYAEALSIMKNAHMIIMVGCSISLMHIEVLLMEVADEVPIYFIDPSPKVFHSSVTLVKKTAVEGVPELVKSLI